MKKSIFISKSESFEKLKLISEYVSPTNMFIREKWFEKQNKMITYAMLGIPLRDNSLKEIKDLILKPQDYLVVDLGGGSGWIFHYAKYLELNFSEQIIFETSKSAEIFGNRENKNEYKYVTNYDQIVNEISSKKSILYSNSFIQYLEDPYKKLSKLLKSATLDWLIFDDLPVTKDQEFCSLQVWYDETLPHNFFNLEKFIEYIGCYNFELFSVNEFNLNLPSDWCWQVSSTEKKQIVNLENPKKLIFRKKN